MKDRHEFRFVVEGVALDPEQAAAVENAIREAGLLAISRASQDDAGFIAVNPRSVFDRLKWRGIWILGDTVAKETFQDLAQKKGPMR